ncbi:MarR family transcriptional regulator [Sphingopyxis terrae]|uniref:DNA-binding transcriptional regulator, MarR family n=1 Tax=Sphingopyxis terrae subsp. ummariensis TaxID=429001 RepID=A0A1Y6ENG9_9SPHN|nr:helix-turn-helix domain-containing protein [Sphingopyxis terrae]PCF92435.1 MarR family transcriptional regulator [Sphingopyxis terrae subsp. ummariensis]SMQ64117.1 DNA-binding transcriptional regulator, MarR family [Sphingopyxis terrae subsp. ummariensis]
MAEPTLPLTDGDYAALAEFRHALRRFQAFSEARAVEQGLTPQQHQALLAIRAASSPPTIGDIARHLLLKPHSATGLINRLEDQGWIERAAATEDRRRARLRLTAKASNALAALSAAHRDEIRRIRPALEEMLASIG